MATDDSVAQALYHLNAACESYMQAGQHAEALQCCEASQMVAPGNAQVLNNYCFALQQVGRYTEAADKARVGLALNPTLSNLHHNYARTLEKLGNEIGAIAAYRKTLELDPACSAAHLNLALLLFRHGSFREAWREYEHRFEAHPNLDTFRKRYAQPHWIGQDLVRNSVVVYDEQGIGDFIHFARYLPALQALGARVIVEVPFELARLLEGQEAADEVLVRDEDVARPASLPPHDYVVSVCSLPFLVGAEADDAGKLVPYIHVGNDWDRPRLQLPTCKDPRIGLVWAGSATHAEDHLRSIPLRALAPLARTRASFFSFQKGQLKRKWPRGEVDLGTTFADVGMFSLEAHLNDFHDTACFLAQMDLLICCDTAVAHLAGAMGKPVWILLPYVADWRWGTIGTQTHWYPSMRIFRQSSARDWDEVVRQVAIALDKFAAKY